MRRTIRYGHKVLTRAVGLGAGATAAVIMLALPANAAPLEQFTFTDEQEEIREDFCGIEGLDVSWYREERGVVLLLQRGPGLLPHAQGAFQGSATYTNLATGQSVTFRWNSMDKSHAVIDNGDGTITETGQISGDRSWWSDGRRIAPDTGTVRFEVLIDTRGTSDPTDDIVDFLGVTQPSTGGNDGLVFNLCAEFLSLTT